jgi:hypothetical protein
VPFLTAASDRYYIRLRAKEVESALKSDTDLVGVTINVQGVQVSTATESMPKSMFQ